MYDGASAGRSIATLWDTGSFNFPSKNTSSKFADRTFAEQTFTGQTFTV